jgi:D-alanyl-D-alanine carboxypeptidase (penicillin-binding protein 5/6)
MRIAMTHRRSSRWSLAALAAVLLAPSYAGAIETTAKQALIVDYQTGSVLLDKNAEEPIHPASMTKMMTLYLLFDQLKQGKLSLTDSFTVSEAAWGKGTNEESNMFLPLNSKVKIEDLIRGIAVQSGNDACLVVAEGISGSQQAFADLMNKKAKEIGLEHSHFVNPSGIEDPDHLMTAHDILVLAERLYTDFPEYYHYFAEKEFTFNGIKQGNRNPALYKDLGVDGLKTGHLSVSGFGIAVSAERDGRRIFMVIHGTSSMQARADETSRLLDWAYQSFQNVTLAKAGATLETAPVWYGAEETVPLTVAKDLVATLPRGTREQVQVKAVFTGPVSAPIQPGQELGKVIVTTADNGRTEVPLVAGAGVDKTGFFGHIVATLRYLLLNNSPAAAPAPASS